MPHFTLIPLDNYKTAKPVSPLALVVSGFSLFMSSPKICFGQIWDKWFSKEMLHLFYSLFYPCGKCLINNKKYICSLWIDVRFKPLECYRDTRDILSSYLLFFLIILTKTWREWRYKSEKGLTDRQVSELFTTYGVWEYIYSIPTLKPFIQPEKSIS